MHPWAPSPDCLGAADAAVASVAAVFAVEVSWFMRCSQRPSSLSHKEPRSDPPYGVVRCLCHDREDLAAQDGVEKGHLCLDWVRPSTCCSPSSCMTSGLSRSGTLVPTSKHRDASVPKFPSLPCKLRTGAAAVHCGRLKPGQRGHTLAILPLPGTCPHHTSNISGAYRGSCSHAPSGAVAPLRHRNGIHPMYILHRLLSSVASSIS